MNGFKWDTEQLQESFLFGLVISIYLAIKHYRHQKVIYWGWIIAFTLVSLQVIAGALLSFQEETSLSPYHMLFLFLVYLVY